MKKLYERIIPFLLTILIFGGMCTISVSAAVTYTNSKGTVTVTCGKYKKKFTAKKYNYNFSRALNAALEAARKKATAKKIATVKVSKGNYSLDRTLKIYSNTTLKATDCRFRLYGNLLRNGYNKKAKTASGYKGAKNITINGGTWDAMVPYSQAGTSNSNIMHSTMRFAHLTNLVVKNCTFTGNYNCHDIEIAGVDGAKITKCIFRNDKPVNTFPNDGGREAVQIDVTTSEAMPEFGKYDATPCKNVTLSYNSFLNKFRGIGSHHAVLGKTYDNILVHHNNFENIGGIAVYAVYWTNTKIYSNTMMNVGLGIDLRSMTTGSGYNFYNINNISAKSAETVAANSTAFIYSNNIYIRLKDVSYARACGIRASGVIVPETDSGTKVKKGIYRIYNVHIGENAAGKSKPNVVTGNVSVGVQVYLGQNCTVRNNSVDLSETNQVTANGMEINGAMNVSVEGNTLTRGYGDNSKAIYVAAVDAVRSSGVNVKLNNIDDFDRGGITVENSDGTVIEGNTMLDCTVMGVALKGAQDSSVLGNTITDTADYSVYVYGSCENTLISGNEITGSDVGIYLKNSNYNSILENKALDTTEHAMIIRECNGNTVSGNTLSSKGCGIRLNYGSDNSVVTANTIDAVSEAVYYVGSNDSDKEAVRLFELVGNTLSAGENVPIRILNSNLNASIFDNFTPDGNIATIRIKNNGESEYRILDEIRAENEEENMGESTEENVEEVPVSS